MSQMGSYTEVSKLVGTGAIGNAYQGYTVKLSEDGNFLIICATNDSNDIGAVWFYQKINGVWTQKQKIVPTGYSGTTLYFGWSMTVNPSMNTLIVGAINENANVGASFVFTFDGATWTQQAKLVGNGISGARVYQGYGVALSADGNTAIIGGPWDGNYMGAAWIFVRSGNTWSQQGSKLVGTGNFGVNPYQGYAVALTSDGNLAVASGFNDNSGIGALWCFLRSGGTSWAQVGTKITATGETGPGKFGSALVLSGDDEVLVVGGYTDSYVGAAWIFKRNGNTFTQFGNKLVGTGATTYSYFGQSVAVNKLGTLVVVGASYDSSNVGGAWIYYFNGTQYNQLGNKIVGSNAVGQAQQGYSVSLDGSGSQLLVGGIFDSGGIGASWVYVNAAITNSPSAAPTAPTMSPSENPTTQPSLEPTTQPSLIPTTQPSVVPTTQPSVKPTAQPSIAPTTQPSVGPTTQPSVGPTTQPSVGPTTQPSIAPMTQPSIAPTTQPSLGPTVQPSIAPTTQPSLDPTTQPSVNPSTQPSVGPTTQPSVGPTTQPSVNPTTQPSVEPTTQPSIAPTNFPTFAPSAKPAVFTTAKPTTAFSSTSSGAFLSVVTVVPVLVCVWVALMYFFFRVYKKQVNKEGMEMKNWIQGNKGEIRLNTEKHFDEDNYEEDDGLEVAPMDNPLTQA